jgi:murein DD-endopeptidase MepM/ murein hydrolase activator NlpD
VSIHVWMLLTSLAAPLPHVSPVLEDLERLHTFPIRARNVSYGRHHHDYPATDIFCPRGSAFVAPIGGVVDFVSVRDDWDPKRDRPELRGGLAVALIGDDGWRYYGSHLQSIASAISVGHRVVEGQLLGRTGASGNARGTPPHLHFGISRPTTSSDWRARRGEIPPYKYLKSWQQRHIRRYDVRFSSPIGLSESLEGLRNKTHCR